LISQFKEEHRLSVFKNSVPRKTFGPKRDEMIGKERRLRNEELYDLYCSPNTIRVIKSRRIGWAGYVARMGDRTGTHRVLIGRPEEKKSFGKSRRRWKGNIKKDIQEVECGGVDWIHLVRDKGQLV
jgi:hypothetical protein